MFEMTASGSDVKTEAIRSFKKLGTAYKITRRPRNPEDTTINMPEYENLGHP